MPTRANTFMFINCAGFIDPISIAASSASSVDEYKF